MISKFPNTRIEYGITGKTEPIFVSDIVNLTENLISSVLSIIGVPSSGFGIISGFEWDYDNNLYSTGLCYMNGILYYTNSNLAGGKYLTPNVTNSFNRLFSDSVARNTYTLYNAVQSNTQYSDMPQFVGNMDTYRLNLAQLKSEKADVANVYSKSSTYSRTQLGSLKRYVKDIGYWDMTSSLEQTFDLSGITTVEKIKGIEIIIKSDYVIKTYPINYCNVASGYTEGSWHLEANILYITIRSGGVFNTGNFASSLQNRGHIIIEYYD